MGLFDERTGGLVTYWKSVAAITALVGTGSDARIWPDAAAQGGETPFVVYTRTGGRIHRHLRGTSGVRTSVVHVYCWGDTRAAADALAQAIKDNTQYQRGTWSGTVIKAAVCEDAPDDGYDKPLDSSAKNKFWTRLILRITHSETGGT